MIAKPPGTIPDKPGSYQFRDAHSRIIYVGKAKSLRQRLSSYFVKPEQLHPRVAAMVEAAASVEWIEVRNELEAVMLEYSLIKEHRPRFNIRMRDDKSYPFLAISTDEEWPRAYVMRGRRRKGNRYFGPYAHAWAIRETLDLLLRSFPVRTCSPSKFRQHERLGRPCLLFHIEKCSGPCVGAVEKSAYREHVEELVRFLNGSGDSVRTRLEGEMKAASESQDFERAAVLRDRLGAIARVLEKQQMVAGSDEDFDLVGVVEDELQAAVQLFHVRHGRVVGRNAHVVDKVEETGPEGLMERIIEGLYEEDPALGIPGLILTSNVPASREELSAWLSARAGRSVEVRVPSRGAKKDLLETVKVNAREDLQRTRLKRSSDHNARSRSLLELRDALELPNAPLRIECFDMAHLQGTDYVGSMVVLEDGLPNRREYRRFKVKEVPGSDDYAAMREVLTRRFSAYLAEREEGATDKRRKFGYPPQLLLVDGGKGQLNVAVEVLEELGLEAEIPVAALAKEFEEVFVPGRSDSIRIPRTSEALYMLQVVRDEAHRFANTFHRELRQKRMTRGALDGIEGLGDRRRKRLIESFGGVRGVKSASLDDLLALSWLPDEVARTVYQHLHR